ncbi:Protein of unknown function [Meinhardsimonia xiamenensis]|jgi:hypothetical protein|uniref:DUF3987 domain-containing protein n=1 Tax=Meinhardsimonia xiamenensis TaxID=990712 RepID=A0A1G8Y9X0_9RHOB|nr:DUF3987 domain-containing protein [Meinhardsimonia xiamenensis]PRX37224.1 uncharacterized protein DUF3987 [Meinhardsimonia xiamenensis]SDJ99648.1 Protein of unknown function [Meinhardsimonia xiamenensis]
MTAEVKPLSAAVTPYTPEAELAAIEWAEPDPALLAPERPEAPPLHLEPLLSPPLAAWVRAAAEGKGAPADYVLAGLLAASGAALGNARWAAPWPGWREPPALWCMVIGNPSAGKSPALDAITRPLAELERARREAAEPERKAWAEKAEVAKIAESAWKEAVKAALKEGEEPPAKPAACDPGPEPFPPRLMLNDATIERVAVILERHPRGVLQLRDELAGWLEGMARYSSGSDRPFWLEAYGGRRYSVERMGRDPVTVERLTVAVLGGIQPDRLKSLMLKADDDGLVARFLPFWPDPAPITAPGPGADDAFIKATLERLHGLGMAEDDAGNPRPWFVPFEDEAQALLTAFRQSCRAWEGEAEGLLLGFTGKLPGMAVRLALILAHLDMATDRPPEVEAVTATHLARACAFLEDYALPMARRAYAEASKPKAERAAARLLAMIREQGWRSFTLREVQRAGRAGLARAADVEAAANVLAEGDVIRELPEVIGPKGGRPSRRFAVNPAILNGAP